MYGDAVARSHARCRWLCWQSLTHPLTHSVVVRSFVRSLLRSFAASFVRSFVRSFVVDFFGVLMTVVVGCDVAVCVPCCGVVCCRLCVVGCCYGRWKRRWWRRRRRRRRRRRWWWLVGWLVGEEGVVVCRRCCRLHPRSCFRLIVCCVDTVTHPLVPSYLGGLFVGWSAWELCFRRADVVVAVIAAW